MKQGTGNFLFKFLKIRILEAVNLIQDTKSPPFRAKLPVKSLYQGMQSDDFDSLLLARHSVKRQFLEKLPIETPCST